MCKMIFALFITCLTIHCYGGTYDVPETVRKDYALKFEEAFSLQSYGLSTKAFYLFQEAYQTALQAGEVPQKLH